MIEKVILVDENDQEIGLMEKIEAHEKALLHRAFSVFLFNSEGKLLLQQRAAHKYHSPELWTNTCCSHQRVGESSLQAGHRRLIEEMGMDCELQETFTFIYKAPFDNGLTEHELDHVLVGITDDIPKINTEEVMDYKYVEMYQLEQEMAEMPEQYTSWFKICFPKVKDFYANELKAKFVR